MDAHIPSLTSNQPLPQPPSHESLGEYQRLYEHNAAGLYGYVGRVQDVQGIFRVPRWFPSMIVDSIHATGYCNDGRSAILELEILRPVSGALYL